MRGRVLLSAWAAGLLLAPAADAAVWKGKTRQGRTATVVTGADGVVNRVRIKYRARCDDGKGFRSGVVFAPPLDFATTTEVRDGGPIQWTFGGSGERARGRSSVTGGLRSSGRWTGDFRLRVKIFKNGRQIATCRTGRVGWKASPV